MATTATVPADLIEEAKRLTGLRTKREVLQFAVSELIRRRKLEDLRGMLGKTDLLMTQEDLARMREHAD